MFFVISTNAFSQKKPETKSTTCQIATIQRDSVMVKLKEYPTQVRILEAYQKQLQSEFDFKKLEFDTKVDDYQTKEKSLTDQQKQDRIAELQKLDDELKKFSKDAEQKLFQKEQELIFPMSKKIDKAIETVAIRQGYTQVMDAKSTYFNLPACDATNMVIEEANK
jgi:outer membrane protein